MSQRSRQDIQLAYQESKEDMSILLNKDEDTICKKMTITPVFLDMLFQKNLSIFTAVGHPFKKNHLAGAADLFDLEDLQNLVTVLKDKKIMQKYTKIFADPEMLDLWRQRYSSLDGAKLYETEGGLIDIAGGD